MLTSLVALLWAGYWFVAATKLKSEVLKLIQNANTEPWSVVYSDISLRGFPNRFDITINDLKFEHADFNISWSLPYFQILSLSYKPNHLILAFPKRQIIRKRQQNMIFDSARMLASISFEDYKFNKLNKFVLDIENSELALADGTKLKANSSTFAIRTQKTKNNTYQAGIRSNGISIDTPHNYSFGQAFVWPQDEVSLKIDTQISFAKAMKIKTKNLPPVIKLKVNTAEIISPNFMMGSTAELSYLADGLPNGNIHIRVSNWSDFLQKSIKKNSNLYDNLKFIFKLANDSDELKLDFKIKKGNIFLGPILLGTFPELFNQ
jgi:hypothetical protein